MELGSILMFVALLVLVTLFVARPLVSPRDEESIERDSGAQADYERVLSAIMELGADREMGKVPEDVYQIQRKQLVSEGTSALKRMETGSSSVERKQTLRSRSKLTDAKLEDLIAARRRASRK